MAVEPGHAGSGFVPATLDRLAERALLGVDGSVDVERARDCIQHGVNWLVSGSSLCAARDPAQWLRAGLRDDAISATENAAIGVSDYARLCAKRPGATKPAQTSLCRSAPELGRLQNLLPRCMVAKPIQGPRQRRQ
jgi:hypothetical protein